MTREKKRGDLRVSMVNVLYCVLKLGSPVLMDSTMYVTYILHFFTLTLHFFFFLHTYICVIRLTLIFFKSNSVCTFFFRITCKEPPCRRLITSNRRPRFAFRARRGKDKYAIRHYLLSLIQVGIDIVITGMIR